MKLILSLLQDINLKVFSKYSNRGKSAEEIDYHDDESINYLKPEPEETIAGIVKLNLRKRKKQERESKLIIINSYLTPSKLLIRLPVSLAQIKTENNSYKYKIR